MTKARNIADLGSNDVIETTATGVDVTGTVQADGLTVKGGDVSFYEDSGTTAKMVWDASDEQLILGGGLAWANNVTGLQLGFNDPDGYVTTYYDNTTVTLGAGVSQKTQVKVHGQSSTEGSAVTVQTGGAERMRIDSSGNVGIANSAPVTRLDIDGFITLRNSAYPSPTSGVFKDGFIGSNDGTLTYAVNGASNGAYGSHKFQVRKGDSSDAIDAMTIDSSGNVGIGTASPSVPLQVQGDGNTFRLDGTANTGRGILIRNAGTSTAYLKTDGNLDINCEDAGRHIAFKTADSERARIDSSGNLLVGKTSLNSAVDGIELRAGGRLGATFDGGNPAFFNRRSSDGEIIRLLQDDAIVGTVGSNSTGDLYIAGNNGVVYLGNAATNFQVLDSLGSGIPRIRPTTDNIADLGDATFRFDDVYATNGTIQTSDRNEKQDIEVLNEAEQRVAQACKGLLRKFRWQDSVEEKGDEARIHFGIIAQDLQDAFTAEGLDAGRYAMFISSTWTDEETGEERTRLGVRYPELLAFIISAL